MREIDREIVCEIDFDTQIVSIKFIELVLLL